TALPSIRIPHLTKGTYSIYGASCVDPERVSAVQKAQIKSPPTLTSAGYVKAFDVYCGPLSEALDAKGNKAPYLQRANTNVELGKLLKAAFDAQERIEIKAKDSYRRAAEYYAKHRDDKATDEAGRQLLNLTANVTSHG